MFNEQDLHEAFSHPFWLEMCKETSHHYKDLIQSFFRRLAAGFTSQVCSGILLKVTLKRYLIFYTCLNFAFI